MTAVPLNPGISPPTRIEWAKPAQYGSIGGLIAVFVVAIGMFASLNARMVIEPILTAGYLMLIWIPLVFGYRVSKEEILEGMAAPEVGVGNVVAGALTGALTGLTLGMFMVLADQVDLTGVLVSLTGRAVEELKFGGSVYTGILVLTLAGALLGAIGGSIHLAPPKLRRVLTIVVITVLSVSFLELVIGDIFRSAGLRMVDQWIFSQNRGLNILPAAIFSALAVVASFFFEGRGRSMRAGFEAKPAETRKRLALIGGLVALALGAFLPSIFGLYLNELLSNVGLFVLLALGLNIVIGYAGLLDLGYVAFFAVGAYTTAMFTSPRSPMFTPELSFFAAMPWVLVAATIAGLIIGTPVIRMRGDYLAIVTLGFGEIIRILLLSDWLTPVFGGAQGIIRISPLPGSNTSGIVIQFGYVIAVAGVIALIVGAMGWKEARRVESGAVTPVPGTNYSTRTSSILMAGSVAAIVLGIMFHDFARWSIVGIRPPDMFRIVLVFVLIACFISWRLRDSRIGRAWMAVREDEQIAQSMGVNIVTTKLLAFVMGAVLASMGGSLFAVKLGTIFPHSFEIILSIIILVIVIVGGMGSIRGVIIGGVVLIGVLGGPQQPGLLREFGEFKLLLYGVILVWMMLKRPEGLWPEARRARELHQDELGQDAWLKTATQEENP